GETRLGSPTTLSFARFSRYVTSERVSILTCYAQNQTSSLCSRIFRSVATQSNRPWTLLSKTAVVPTHHFWAVPPHLSHSFTTSSICQSTKYRTKKFQMHERHSLYLPLRSRFLDTPTVASALLFAKRYATRQPIDTLGF